LEWIREKGERAKKRILINRIIGNGDFRKLTGARGDMETPRFFYILNHGRFEKQHVSGSPVAGI
jgi:hypothetical protein